MNSLYNKIIAYTLIGAILAVPAMVLADSNSTLTDSAPATNAAPAAPSTGDAASTAVSAPSTGAPATTATAPSTGDAGTTAGPAVPPTDSAPATTAAPAAPSTGDAASTAAPAAPSTGDTTSTAGPAPVVTPVVTPAPATGGGVSFGGGGGGFSGGGTSSSGGSSFVAPTPVLQCPYLNTTLKFGGNNLSTEVSKLQTFLKSTEGYNVDITGIYDQKTFDAVKAFQIKYASDILAPWGVTTPTGNVYITTKNKINGLYCNSTIFPTASELSEINAYKNSAKASTTVGSQINSSNPIPLTPTSTPDQQVGSANSNTQVAAVANTSFFGKIWSFVKHIFGR